MKIVTTVLLLAATPTLVLAKGSQQQRVEVPVYMQNNFAFVDITVGNSAPLAMFIDTGAGGIRIHPGNISDTDVQHTGIENRIGYADGKQGLIGEEVRGKVRMGGFTFPGITGIQLIKHHFCKQGIDDQCKRGPEESKHGGAGTIGLGSIDDQVLTKKMQKTDVLNPFLTNGKISYILNIPKDESSKGYLIIHPTQAEKARFTRFPLSKNGKSVPVCVNQLCYTALLDSGAGGSNIPVASRREMKMLNLPNDGEHVTPGTVVPISIGSGNQRVTVNYVAGEKGGKRVALKDTDKAHGTFGINLFHNMDVLYDMEYGYIGFAPK